MACAHALSQKIPCQLFIIWEPSSDCLVEWGDIFDETIFPMPKITMQEIGEKYPQRKVFYNDRMHTDVFLQSQIQTPVYQGIIISGGHDFKHPEMSEEDLIYLKHTYYQMLIRYAHMDLLKEINQIPFQVSSMIGVHIRIFVSKFDAADQYDFENNTVLEVTSRSMNDALLRNPNASFFICCNDDRPVRVLEDLFGKDKIFTYEGSFSEHGNRDTKDGIKNAFINLALLSKTKIILGTYRSSFSDEACVMGMVTKVCTTDKQHDEPYHCYGHSVKNNRNYILYSQPTVSKLLSFHTNNQS
jgi:hypothetical protein